MTGASLILCLLSAAPTGQASFGAVGLDAGVGGGSGGASWGWDAEGGLFASFYPMRPVVDDDAPPSLQPFLQKVTSLSLGGSALRSKYWNGQEVVSGTASVSAQGYLWGRLFLAAGFDLGHSTSHEQAGDESYTTLAPNASLGVRLSTAVLSLSYGYLTTLHAGRWRPRPDWGRLRFNLHAAFADSGEFSLSFGSVNGGISASLAGTYYALRTLGLSVSAGYAQGALFVDSTRSVLRLHCGAGLRWWATSRVAVSLAYSLIWTRTLWLAHEGTLALVVRLPTDDAPVGPQEYPDDPERPRRPDRPRPSLRERRGIGPD